jgi:regulator of replication initiation timing
MADFASIGAALGSVKTLWELARSTQDAHLAMKISAELGAIQRQLIDVQQQAIALQKENQTQRNEIDTLKAKLDETVQAEPCPKCLKKGFRVESSRPHPTFGHLGALHRVYKCIFCEFTEGRVLQPK